MAFHENNITEVRVKLYLLTKRYRLKSERTNFNGSYPWQERMFLSFRVHSSHLVASDQITDSYWFIYCFFCPVMKNKIKIS